MCALPLGSSRPLKPFLLLLLPFPDCDCPRSIPALTSARGMPWARAEPPLRAGLSQASPLGGFPGGEQPPSEHLCAVHERCPSLSGFWALSGRADSVSLSPAGSVPALPAAASPGIHVQPAVAPRHKGRPASATRAAALGAGTPLLTPATGGTGRAGSKTGQGRRSWQTTPPERAFC